MAEGGRRGVSTGSDRKSNGGVRLNNVHYDEPQYARFNCVQQNAIPNRAGPSGSQKEKTTLILIHRAPCGFNNVI